MSKPYDDESKKRIVSLYNKKKKLFGLFRRAK
jgi:hypothetical protein